MNLIEAGAVPGALAGAALGGIFCKAHGIVAIIGGILGGGLCGLLAGCLYAYFTLLLLAIIGVAWCALFRRSTAPPSDAAMTRMSQFARPGVALGILLGALLVMHWIHALIAMLVMAVTMAFFAVAMQQFRRNSS